MGLINREKDQSEQRENFDVQTAVVGVSALIQLGNMPYPGQILKIVSSAFGLSGAPILGLQIQRFIVGSGLTTIPVNGSSLLTISAFSTSGMQTHVLPAAGFSSIQVLSGDAVQLVTSVANSAATYNVNMIVQCLQDFKSTYGLS